MDCLEKIDSLYEEYHSLLGKENVEVALKTKKDSIVIEIAKIFYLSDNGFTYEDSSITHKRKVENKEFSCEIFEKTLECLKYFDKDKQKDTSFAKYTIKSVSRKLKSLKAEKSVKEDNSGAAVSRETINLVRKIKKTEEMLIKMGKSRQEIEFKLQELYNLSEKKLEKLLSLANNKKISLDKPISDDEKNTGIDTQSEKISSEKTYEDYTDFTVKLQEIQSFWSIKRDKCLSELLTIEYIPEIEKYHKFIDSDLYKNYTFLDKSIIDEFFDNIKYKIPTQTEIGNKYGLSKSGISKKLSRFYEKLKSSNVNNNK